MSELPAPAGHTGPRPQQVRSFVPSPAVHREDFDTFYVAEKKLLTKFLMYQGASEFEADDAAHQALLAVLPDLWTRLEYPGAYLRTAALRFYWRQNDRREQSTGEVPDMPGGICPVAKLALSEESRTVIDAIRQLPPAQRDVLAWSLDGFTAEEIAAALRRTPAAVRQNLHRARRQLKINLGLEEGETRE
ncbi:RNA polymerase sigma factor [Streptomyces sp. NBC_01451]|uniref:RNA polymerase sigma factor n=1 Tax=Streptomyces sp. NBC_01451 TaxID=2903872 RepID=UPI002E376244|nr:sigma-70 family RNA polymerase sigma factor [Streptomyces sp. NBC_01451]